MTTAKQLRESLKKTKIKLEELKLKERELEYEIRQAENSFSSGTVSELNACVTKGLDLTRYVVLCYLSDLGPISILAKHTKELSEDGVRVVKFWCSYNNQIALSLRSDTKVTLLDKETYLQSINHLLSPVS